MEMLDGKMIVILGVLYSISYMWSTYSEALAQKYEQVRFRNN